MFEFLLALFGGISYAGKIYSDNAKVSAERLRTIKAIELNKIIGNNVKASYELQESIKGRILGGKSADKILEELHDDLRFVFGEDVDITKSFHLPIGRVGRDFIRAGSDAYWAYHLLLSHQGKVDDDTYDFGFCLGGTRTVEKDIRFCHRIEQNLNRNGAGLKLYLQPKYSTYTKSYDWNPCAKYMVFEHQLYSRALGKRLW